MSKVEKKIDLRELGSGEFSDTATTVAPNKSLAGTKRNIFDESVPTESKITKPASQSEEPLVIDRLRPQV